MTTERGLQVRPEDDIVRPAVSPQQALDAWGEYQAMKSALATPEDRQQIQGREFLKKSYWRKVERFYKLSLACVNESHEDTPNGRVFYALYRATHPSGAFADGDGSDYAGSIEEYHNARATAHTRAKNRAIADLVGGGEVSAEEMPKEGGNPEFWCEKHKTNWFKKGPMRGYAHPVDGEKRWCSKPAVVDAPKAPAAAPQGPPSAAQDDPEGIFAGEGSLAPRSAAPGRIADIGALFNRVTKENPQHPKFRNSAMILDFLGVKKPTDVKNPAEAYDAINAYLANERQEAKS